MDWDGIWQLLTHWVTGSKPAAQIARVVIFGGGVLFVVLWCQRLSRKVDAIARAQGLRFTPVLGLEITDRALVSKPSRSDPSAPQQVATERSDSA